MSRELLKQALVALQKADEFVVMKTIKNIEVELTKPDPKPVKWWDEKYNDVSNVERIGWVPLYTLPPRQQEPLDTDILDQLHFENEDDPIAFARDIEEAHGIGGEK